MFKAKIIENVPEATLNKNLLGNKRPGLIILSGGFSTCDARYKFEIKSDGTGRIVYSNYGLDSEDFSHESDLVVLREEIEQSIKAQFEISGESAEPEDSEIENVWREITADKLEEFFWEEINPILENPFFRSFDDDGEWGSEFSCENGSAAEMEEFLKLCVFTEREIVEPDDYLIVDSETDCEAAGLNDCSYRSERLSELARIACRYYKPVGYRYDYNDGWNDRYSGYSLNCETLSISLKEFSLIPAREKMIGMITLRRKLAEMDIESDLINRLTEF